MTDEGPAAKAPRLSGEGGPDGMTEPGTMEVRGGVSMGRLQYLAGFKEGKASSYPTIRRPDVQVPHKIDGTIDDVFKKYPDMEPCLFNDVKLCSCGKPCAYTLTACNACGKPLPDTIVKSENVFAAFLFGVKSASKGFPYIISLRRETEDCLIFDDMLQLSPCHLNCIPKKYYIPDWRFLLLCPKQSLALIQTLEEELWAGTQPFMEDFAYMKNIYRGQVTAKDVRKNVISCFNFPPSQFQLHVQWIVPPLTPFQHFMGESHNHFHYGRCFPLSYVRNLLSLDKPYAVTKDTKIEDIMAWGTSLGVDYDKEWTAWCHDICLGSTLSMQNWDPDSFQYVVEDGKVHDFSVADGKIQLGNVVADANAPAIQAKDKVFLQNYGRAYTAAGKPTGTYIQNPLEPKWGAGGLLQWPPA